jgi:CO/xanthine dehydrogenase Mo-binding subunit
MTEGRVEPVMGTMSSGQGHETSFAQLVTEWLGVPFESITYVAHDTTRVKAGGGSHSGRSMKLATTIIGKATDDIIDKGRKIASFLLETAKLTSSSSAADTESQALIARSASSRSPPRPPLRARICQRICKGRSPASPTRPFR